MCQGRSSRSTTWLNLLASLAEKPLYEAVELNRMLETVPLENKRILFFVGDIYEDLELWYPKLRLIEACAEVCVAGPEAEG